MKFSAIKNKNRSENREKKRKERLKKPKEKADSNGGFKIKCGFKNYS